MPFNAGLVTKPFSSDVTIDLLTDYIKIDTSAGAVAVTLPSFGATSALNYVKHEFHIEKTTVDANAVTISVSGGALINGAATFVLAAQYDVVHLWAGQSGGYTAIGSRSAGAFGATVITSASAQALAVGLNGATNPAFVVDDSTASQAAGLKVAGAVSGGTVAVVVIDFGAAANLSINAKGTGTIGIGNVSTGAITITPATTITGILTPTGGVAAAGGFSASPRGMWIGQTAPQVSTDFNNSTPVVTETYISEIFVPCNMTITGIALFNGSDVTGNVTVGLATSAGAPIAAAKSASTAGSGVDSIQRVPFAVAYAAVGPATYYIQVQYNSGTARYNTHVLGNHGVLVQTSQTYGTLMSFTAPSTFVTNVGNVGGLY